MEAGASADPAIARPCPGRSVRRRIVVLLMLTLVVAAGPASSITAAPAPRLVADNRTSYSTDIYVWSGSAWNFVSRLAPHSFQAFPNAGKGSLWRAVIGQSVKEHRVNYVYDARYGGYQDVWWIQ